MTTPADELKAAAARLRELATAAADDSGSPTWEARRRWPDDPDHTSTTLRAVNGDKLIHGYTRGRLPGPFVTGPVGDYIAAMDPTVGLLLADWLDAMATWAREYPEMAHDHDRPACDDYACDVMGRALDLARVINGGKP